MGETLQETLIRTQAERMRVQNLMRAYTVGLLQLRAELKRAQAESESNMVRRYQQQIAQFDKLRANARTKFKALTIRWQQIKKQIENSDRS